jgi:hypothetical protein
MSSFSKKFNFFFHVLAKFRQLKKKVDANVDAVPATRLNQHSNLEDLIEQDLLNLIINQGNIKFEL